MRYIHQMLTEASGRIRGHMPGHKGVAPFGTEDLYHLDTTEIDRTEDLYHPGPMITAAQNAYAAYAGAGAALFLSNGSTCGIHAMLSLYTHPGDTVILPRNAHVSAINACALLGLEPVWIPITIREDGYVYVREEDALSTIRSHPEAKSVLIIRPDYYGGMLPLEHICETARAFGMKLLVDEAHGAHLPSLEGCKNAMAFGADAAVDSTHKTLPAFTSCATLLLKDSAEAPRARQCIRFVQTSSPSYILLMTADDAREYMECEGKKRLAELANLTDGMRKRLPDYGYQDAHEQWADTGLCFDSTRLVIHAPQGGEALLKALSEYGIDCEMCDENRIVIILTCMDDKTTIDAIEQALKQIPAVPIHTPSPRFFPHMPPRILSVRKAMLGDNEWIPARDAAGHVCSLPAGLYPPGIPLVCPGEMITEEISNLLAASEHTFGLEGECICCVKPSSLTSTER